MKVLVTNYTFDASAQTVTFSDYSGSGITLENVLLITNVTDQVIIYQFNDTSLGGSVATNVLTLEYNTTSMADTDDLQIWYWDDSLVSLTNGLLVNLGSNNDVTLATLPDTAAGDLAAINAATDGLEALLTTIDADTSALAAALKTEDAAHNSGDTGFMALAVRNDTLSALAGTDGDYAPLQVDADGALYTKLSAAQSTLGVNSSNEAANSSYSNWATDTWTGSGEQNSYDQVGVSLQTDDAGGTLFFDFSVDGTNWTTFPVNGFTVATGTHEFHTAVKLGRYFRPRFVGTGSRTYFRLYTYYGNTFLPTNAPLNQSISADSDAIITRSVLVGAKDDGTYVNIGATDTGGLKTGQDAEIDSNNSTTTPLSGSATYTGTGTDIRGYGGITVNVFADQDGVAGGMDFQFSTDNTNWISTGNGGFDYLANTERTFQFNIQAQYFRVVFQNDSSAQSAFRVQTLLHRNPVPLTTIHRADATLAPDRSATLTKAVLMAQVNGSGNLVPVQASASGILKTSGSGGGVTDTAYNEDTAHSNADAGSFILAVRRDTATSGASADGDYSSFNVNSTGNLYTIDEAAEALLTTIDADTSTISTNSGTIAAGFAAEGAALGSGVLLQGDDGTDRKNINVDATTGDVQVDVTNTVTVQENGAALTALQLIDNIVSGSGANISQMNGVNVTMGNGASGTGVQRVTLASDSTGQVIARGAVAHDGVDSGNPLKIGGRAQAPTAALEEVADNDRVDAAFDRQGRLAVWMGYPVQSADINDATSGDNTIVAAQGAGLRIAVLGYHLVSDGTVDVRWEDGAAGTAFTGQMPFQAREGIVAGYGFQPMWVGTANTLLNLELSAAINVHGQVSYVVMTD